MIKKMKAILKKCTSIALVGGILLTSVVSANASSGVINENSVESISTDQVLENSGEINNNFMEFNLNDQTLKESEVIKSENGNKVFEIEDLEGFIEKNNISDAENLKGIAISFFDEEDLTEAGDINLDEISSRIFSSYYVKKISVGGMCGRDKIRESSYAGPAKATMTISENVQASYSANVSVSADIVTAGVGFNVTKGFGVSDSYSVDVPKGETYTIVAIPLYDAYNFEVWKSPLIGSDSREGTGVAYKPTGVCFYYY